ncbi:Putative multidrug export ATP-binding/permease protein [Methylacidimicrobium cyclopophantes]|uniref:Multidrug export ATP-binding/permease protein n=1 Tax=Methylacidimicrobium cyclopophantes TaxID=1041766 RepID=A0A5E6MA42_9BACT|nr:ABC transporter ATP-binding protein [Methylacidimicrobium cyclopophantes]VVM06412.1 Putative multidrug export ATP-binding/permease protein [Methylacidimicrobium cyclopophantes]
MRELWKVLQFSSPFLRKHWKILAAGMLCGFLFATINGTYLFVLKAAIDNFVGTPAPIAQSAAAEPKQGSLRTKAGFTETLRQWMPMMGAKITWKQVVGGLLLLPGVALVRGLFRLANSYFMNLGAGRIVADLQTAVLQKLHALSMDFYHRSTTGDLSVRILSDTQGFYQSISILFTDVAKDPFTLLAILISCATIDWRLTLVAALLIPICIVPAVLLSGKVRRSAAKIVSTAVDQNNLLLESVAGVHVIKAFSLEQRNADRFRKQANDLARQSAKMNTSSSLVSPSIDVIASLALSLLILTVVWQHVSIANMAVIANGALLFFAPIRRLADANVKIQEGAMSAKRLSELLETPASVQEAKHAKPIREFTEAVCFDHVTFHYGNRLVLKDVSFTLPKGAKIGIAGPSGAGKSTITSLLLRFYDPVEGAIRIDGQDLRDLKLQDARALFSLVSQDVVIFNLTAAENIAIGKPHATQEEIEEAARMAGAHEFLSQLPQGYHTKIGERGVKLSGGQRQRLSIARAFIRNAPILILDEATSNLDSHSEAQVQASIESLEQGRTVLLIAHRLSTLAGSDWIFVLEEGRIVQKGTYAELLEAEGPFRWLAERQGLCPVAA